MSSAEDGMGLTVAACIMYPPLFWGIAGLLWACKLSELYEQDQIDAQKRWADKLAKEKAEELLKPKKSMYK